MKKLMIAVLSLATVLSSVPVSAAPAFVANPTGTIRVAPQANVETVGCNNMTNCPDLDQRWGNEPRYYHRDRGHHWDRDRRDYRRDYGRRYDRDRHHNNAGAIIGGLAAGAIIGGVIASQSGARSSGSHEQYCASKYRSYRAYDNTYQPLNGPRRECR